jgi:hypothetical protein
MPLLSGKKNVGKNIKELMTTKPGATRKKAINTLAKKTGLSKKKAEQKQAVAIAYSKAKKGGLGSSVNLAYEKQLAKGGSVPKTARGKAMVAKLGRTKKTGNFAKIAKSASKEYGSAKAGKRVAGAIFQKMVKARK